jgi:uridine kinase
MRVIGIAGPSCSGKSTVAKIVAEQLGASVLCFDHLYQHGKGKEYVRVEGQIYRTFERPELYDHERFPLLLDRLASGQFIMLQDHLKNDTYHKVEPNENLIVEGFLLFTYPSIQSRFNDRFYIDLSPEEMVRRRIARDRTEYAQNFAKIGPIEYARYGLPQRGMPGILIIDGKLPLESIASRILDKL